jgi:hypothetical protein
MTIDLPSLIGFQTSYSSFMLHVDDVRTFYYNQSPDKTHRSLRIWFHNGTQIELIHEEAELALAKLEHYFGLEPRTP